MGSCKKSHILLGVFLSIFTLMLNAQIETFRNINNGDGLIDWQIYSFFKDRDGFMWTGGSFSVQRFDGRYIRVYTFPYTITKVNTITQIKNGLLYIGTSNGLFTVNQYDQQAKKIFASQINTNVSSIYIDKEDNIFVGTDNGLCIISGNKFKTINLKNNLLPNNRILSIQQIKNNGIWLLTSSGIISFNPKNGKITSYPIVSKNKEVLLTNMTAIDQMLYIGTSGSGIYTFDTQNTHFEKYINVGDNTISCLSSDGKSQLYAGTAGTGIYFISLTDKKVTRSFDSSPRSKYRLTSSKVTTLLVDKQNILWVGNGESLGFDFLFLEPKAFVLYKTTTFSTDNLPIHSLYIDETFKLLSNSYGIYYVSNKTGKVQFFEHGIGKATCLKSGNVFSYLSYKNKVILGGQCGIYSFNPVDVSIEIYKPFAFLSDATIYHINSDSQKDIWVASSKGLHVLNVKTQKISSYTTQNSKLIDNEVHFVYFDRLGRTWVCTKNGVCFFSKKTNSFKTGKFPKGFIDKELIRFIMEDKKGNILFCYRTKQAFISDHKLRNFRQVCTLNDADFTGNWINKILQDKEGTFWFIGSRGTIKANESLTSYQLFSTTEGLMEPYASDGCFDSSGKLWLSNNKGLYYSSENFKRTHAPMAITDIKINGVSKISEMYNSIIGRKLITLNNDENNIEIEFAQLTYDRPDLMVYECKLNENSENWYIIRGLNNISYKNLKPGKYKFIVRRNMDHSCFSEINFEIKPIIFTYEIPIILIFTCLCGVGLFWHKKLKKRKKNEINNPTEVKIPKYQFNKISNVEAQNIISKLKRSMEQDKLYLNQSLKMPELATAIGCSNQTLSQVFNLFMNDKYYDFINRYRIDEFKRIISETDYENFTIKALSEQSGFSSYTSFFRTFKEQTGITPNDYIRNFEKQKL